MSREKRQKFIDLLYELFQLNQPELDFGLYRILHARSHQIKRFIDEELAGEIEKAFKGRDAKSSVQKLADARRQVEANVADDALDAAGELKPEHRNTKAGKAYLQALREAREGGGALSYEAQVYDHLIRFFSRYYDSGDFMSRRHFVAENDTRAAPYAVPYDGREVYLHWANKDQYYIKTTEYLADYQFNLAKALAKINSGRLQVGLELSADTALPVHFHLVDAAPDAHNNVREQDSRFFIIHAEEPVKLVSSPINKLPSSLAGQVRSKEAELLIQFEYRADPGKEGQEKAWRQKRLKEAENIIFKALEEMPEARAFLNGLRSLAPTEKEPHRTVLAKHLMQYTARHTMDYFIHKDLSGFLKRELDFYIKNEILRLDHVDSIEPVQLADQLEKIRCLRRIAHTIIAFLAQVENFQKKLWLKKKFVTETNYCITLDRVPESFYPEICANERQREEWVDLFSISNLDSYTQPLTADFLGTNPYLLLDTARFTEEFKFRLLAKLEGIDQASSGLLIHGDNFHALSLLRSMCEQSLTCAYIDPPYNTDAGPIDYKNGYKSSSWLAMMDSRVHQVPQLLRANGLLCSTIDDCQQKELHSLLEGAFPAGSIAGTVAIRANPSGRPTQTGFALAHEYAIFVRKAANSIVHRMARTEAQLRRFDNKDDLGLYELRNFRREGSNSARAKRKRLFYPIYVTDISMRVPTIQWDTVSEEWLTDEQPIVDETVLFPIDDAGTERTWRWSHVRVMVDRSQFVVKRAKGTRLGVYYKYRPNIDGAVASTIWADARYSATEYGTAVLKHLFGEPVFSYPKSVHAVNDCLELMGLRDESGSVLDYLAGSGTTAHAVINLNREDGGNRKYILVEMADYFDTVLMPRIKKVVYSNDWRNGKPISREGISHCFKYLRLESYEDALNNLELHEDAERDNALEQDRELRRDYVMRYLLDVETNGSASLLNVCKFSDPTSYALKLKKSNSDESVERPVDLIETFNWLIGLHVDLLDKPRTFTAEFQREHDPDLPQDQNTRLKVKGRLRESSDGTYWFRTVEGWVARTPGSETDRDNALVIWRKLSDDPDRDSAALEAFLAHKKINLADTEFDTVYINGPLGLPMRGDAKARIVSLEETFHARMWADNGA